jgi:hypothetical protein
VPRLRDSDELKQDKLFKALVAKNMTLSGYSFNNELAPKMHMHERTFNYKIQEPDRFTRKELRLLFRILKFSNEEKSQVI